MIKVKCRVYEGDLIELEENYAITDIKSQFMAVYRLCIRLNNFETVEINNVNANEIEFINAKTAD